MISTFLMAVSIVVIILGLYGLMSKKNLIKMFMTIEIIFFGVIIAVATLALVVANPLTTQFFILIIALVAALEEAIGVGILLVVKNVTGTIDADTLTELKE
ncbi:MAG: NADH-quinone oxidoreductase subunit K [Candidatus Korarchaeota archaeon]|nr:NADH-quinone oxidoreductase subunit K [Thermoproteota archaeon]MCR8472336.1 NADH-quinone oxidoreductase subunit K [Thermoproteota archaeon]MCR8473668.1 NADH-quinone oxidoreductase subunit K [Thermoproteota archaeon]